VFYSRPSPDGRILIVSLRGDIKRAGGGFRWNHCRLDPGEEIAGTLEISVHNGYPSGHVVPVGATVTWGDRQSQPWQIDSSVGTGWTDFSVGISETAPTTPSLYYIVFALANECRYFHVMSAANWAVDGSPTTCGSPESPPIWFDGNDLGQQKQTQRRCM
jgi:hypothetical protein